MGPERCVILDPSGRWAAMCQLLSKKICTSRKCASILSCVANISSVSCRDGFEAAFHDGYIAVSDKDNHRIQVFNENGQFHHFIPKDWTASYFDPLKPGSLLGPMGMCVDRHDRLFVADCGSDRVQIFSREGDFLWCSPTKPDSAAGFWFQSPTAMAADDQGLVYVASDHCVQVF